MISVDGNDTDGWTATDPDEPAIVGHGATEAAARLSFQAISGLRNLAVRSIPEAPAAAPAPPGVTTFGKVYAALLAAGWSIAATTYPHGVEGDIAALLVKDSRTFMALGRDEPVSAGWLAAIVAATGLDPASISG